MLLDLTAGAEELPPVAVSDCGGVGTLGDVAGGAPALSLAVLDLRDFLLGAGSLVPAFPVVEEVAGCSAAASLPDLDFLDFLVGFASVELAVVVDVASVAFAFFDFCSELPASAVAAGLESSAVLAFFDFFDFVALLSSEVVEVVVL